ncbi:MAG: DUF4914 family protein [Anaerolineales bacterium]
MVSQKFLRVETQPEVGEAGYDARAEILYDFFRACLQQFNVPDLDPLGREIITCCLDGGSADDYARLIPQT